MNTIKSEVKKSLQDRIDDCRRKLTAQKKIGSKHSEETKEKMSLDRQGENNSNWKGGLK